MTINYTENGYHHEIEVSYVDDSFSHEFGIERCGHWEVESSFRKPVEGGDWESFEADEEQENSWIEQAKND